jgi:siroheme synthase-like protein
VAARKARGLLEAGALVTVVAPLVGPEMEALGPLGELAVERRAYASGEAAHYRLVVTATGRPEVDSAVYADAEAAGVWVNSADDSDHCSFILPAVHRDGPVTIAVSTAGLSPALASWLRRQVATQSGPGLGALAQLLGRARALIKASGRGTESVDWAALLDGPLPALVRNGEMEAAVRLVEAAAGVDLSGG